MTRKHPFYPTILVLLRQAALAPPIRYIWRRLLHLADLVPISQEATPALPTRHDQRCRLHPANPVRHSWRRLFHLTTPVPLTQEATPAFPTRHDQRCRLHPANP